MYNHPMINQQMAQLEQEFAQRKADIMQSFYNQQQGNDWNRNNTQQSQTPSQNVNWIYVSGIDGAKNQIVQPGQTAWMMDNNDPYFYVKSVDGVGSSTFRIFQFSEVTEITPEPETQSQIDMSQYVRRAEFDDLKAQLEQFTNTQKKQPQKANKGVEDNG